MVGIIEKKMQKKILLCWIMAYTTAKNVIKYNLCMRIKYKKCLMIFKV